jgi:hypothetical protein
VRPASAAPTLSLFAVLIAAASAPSAFGQQLTERVIGTVELTGPLGGGAVISKRGDQLAKRERVQQGERYVSTAGAGPTFTRILPGAVWVGDRLVYFALQGQQKVLVDGKKIIKLKGAGTSPSLESRPWLSGDGLHYAAFDSTGTTVRWYLDGKLQSSTFDKLAAVSVVAPLSKPMVVAGSKCLLGILGDAASGGYRWDIVNWVRASADGKYVYAYGHRANLARLELNGKKVFEGPLDQFALSTSGATWMAVLEQTVDEVVKTEVLRGGKVVATASADRSRVKLSMTTDGSTWALSVSDEDYTGMTLSRPGKPDRRFDQAPLEFHRFIYRRTGTRRP